MDTSRTKTSHGRNLSLPTFKNESDRLHHTMENITHALEIDKRKGANLDERIAQLKHEIETKRKAHR